MVDDETYDKIRLDPEYIKLIDKPSKSLQRDSVDLNPLSIQYIENPSESIQLRAIDNDVLAYYFIKKPTARARYLAIEKHPHLIRDFKKITDDMRIKILIDYNKDSFHFIDNPSDKVKMAILGKYPHQFLRWIKNPTYEMLKTAVTTNGYSIEFIDNPTEELQLLALNCQVRSFQVINNPCHKAFEFVAKVMPVLFRHVSYIPVEIQLDMLAKNLLHLEYIKNPDIQALTYYNLMRFG